MLNIGNYFLNHLIDWVPTHAHPCAYRKPFTNFDTHSSKRHPPTKPHPKSAANDHSSTPYSNAHSFGYFHTRSHTSTTSTVHIQDASTKRRGA